MPRNPYYILLNLLLLPTLWIHSCKAQEDTNSKKEMAEVSQIIPEITGTPPPLIREHNPYNDTKLVSQYIRSIFQDSKGNYWFGPAGQSVARYDGKTLHYFSKEEFFRGNDSVRTESGNSVHAIEEDAEGNLWFGTEYGAVKYDGESFRSYAEKEGLSNLRIGRKSILSDSSGKLWVGTNGGFFQYNPAADTAGGRCFSLFSLLPPIQAADVMEDQEGNIWFASRNQGVFRYDGKTVENLSDGLKLGSAYAGGMAQDKAGNYWFTMQDGICKYDGKTITNYTSEDGIGGSEIWGIRIENSGIIWITARGATTRFDPTLPQSDPKRFRIFTVADGLNCCVQSMYEDRLGNMWWGTGQGLYRFDGENFYQVKQQGPW